MEYRSYDPYRLVLRGEYQTDDRLEVSVLQRAGLDWGSLRLDQRATPFLRLAEVLEADVETYARLISHEVGKPLAESRQELIKCVRAIRHLVESARDVLQVRHIASEARSSFLLPEPFGLLLAVMPWNFPFWQVIRFSVPNMLAGNTVLLKHAPNVPDCALALEAAFEKSGFPQSAFKNAFLSANGVRQWLSDPLVSGFAFTGSDGTGSLLGAIAGQSLKKSLMELGGNDPMIVFGDADPEAAAEAAAVSRCINAGQSCNGAKRFIVQRNSFDRFTTSLTEKVAALKTGDPLLEDTRIGPLARFDLLERVREQVIRSVSQGATPVFIAPLEEKHGWFYPPTVLAGVEPGNTAFEDEIFGPVWSVTVFDSEEQAVQLANRSRYGLGASVWTNDEARIERMIRGLQTGNVFINDFVRSDPRFPFGGVKRSGYGKDLGREGFLEFVNWKTVYRRG